MDPKDHETPEDLAVTEAHLQALAVDIQSKLQLLVAHRTARDDGGDLPPPLESTADRRPAVTTPTPAPAPAPGKSALSVEKQERFEERVMLLNNLSTAINDQQVAMVASQQAVFKAFLVYAEYNFPGFGKTCTTAPSTLPRDQTGSTAAGSSTSKAGKGRRRERGSKKKKAAEPVSDTDPSVFVVPEGDEGADEFVPSYLQEPVPYVTGTD
jgi:hypothetical protein